MPVGPQSLKELFLEAIDMAPSDRARWLDEVCDPALREHLVKMLNAHDVEQALFDAAPSAAPGAALARYLKLEADPWALVPRVYEAAGTTLGPYRLLRQIGEGGSATVWLAEQSEPVPRQVALKILHTALMSRQVLARFRVELQALALMDHANIARILDAGTTESGRPYIAMELVRGVPITRFCDERKLRLPERLRLFVQVCRAVQHAHIKGIIHRDLKPSNVLVGEDEGQPVAKVIDFSIAKVMRGAGAVAPFVTAFGTLVGTLEYMSPEQADLNQTDVDSRSDVYSLGVLLYELLTGTTPLTEAQAKAPLLDVLRAVREREPAPPSSRVVATRAIPGLAEARGTVPAKLSRSLRGDLDCIVLKALEKDRDRRYQSAADVAADLERYLADEPILARPPSLVNHLRKLARRHKGSLAVGLGLVTALLVAMAGVGWSLRDRAARRADAERERGDRVARATSRAELAMTKGDQLALEQQWEEALMAVRRAESSLAEGELDHGTRDRLAQAVKELEFVGALDKVRSAASVWKEGGFDFAGADRAYGQAFRSFGIDVEAMPIAEAAVRLQRHGRIGRAVAVSLDHWGLVRGAPGQGESPGPALADLAARLDPDPLRVRLRKARRKKAGPALQEELRSLAAALDASRQSPATLNILAVALGNAGLGELKVQVLRQAQKQHPDDFWVNLQLANALRERKQTADEVQFNQVAVALRPSSTAALNNLGHSLLELGRTGDAADCFRKAVSLDPRFAIGHRSLARAQEKSGDLDGAAASLRKSLELEPRNTAALDQLAKLLTRQGKRQEAFALLQKAVEVDPGSSACQNNLGLAFDDRGQLAEAVLCYRKAVELDPKNTHAHNNLGGALATQGKLAEAVACHHRAIALEPGQPEGHNGLARTLAMQGKLAEAVACWRKAAACQPPLATVHKNLGRALVMQGDLDGAGAAFRKAAELDPKDGPTVNNLAYVLLQQGKGDEAVNWFRKSVTLAPKAPRAHYNLGFALARQGKHDEARPSFRQALELARQVVKQRPTAASLETLAEAASQCEQWREAVEARQRLARLRAPDAADKFRLAMAHWQAGNRDEARKWRADAAREPPPEGAKGSGLADLKKQADALLAEPPLPKPPNGAALPGQGTIP